MTAQLIFFNLLFHCGNLLSLYLSHASVLTCSILNVTCFKDEEEAGLLEQVKSVICDNIAMYAQKYDEEFAPHLPVFVTAVWNLLINTGQQVKYDLVRYVYDLHFTSVNCALL